MSILRLEEMLAPLMRGIPDFGCDGCECGVDATPWENCPIVEHRSLWALEQIVTVARSAEICNEMHGEVRAILGPVLPGGHNAFIDDDAREVVAMLERKTDPYKLRSHLSTWLRTRIAHDTRMAAQYDFLLKTGDIKQVMSQLAADVDHSSLLVRLFEGKDPLPEPPPLSYGYPKYPD